MIRGNMQVSFNSRSKRCAFPHAYFSVSFSEISHPWLSYLLPLIIPSQLSFLIWDVLPHTEAKRNKTPLLSLPLELQVSPSLPRPCDVWCVLGAFFGRALKFSTGRVTPITHSLVSSPKSDVHLGQSLASSFADLLRENDRPETRQDCDANCRLTSWIISLTTHQTGLP